MKKPKIIEIPTDRPLTFKEYEKLRKHAINSATWNVQNYSRNSWQIIDKLKNKGYPTEDVTYTDTDNNIHTSNLIDETLQKLIEDSILDDKQLAEDYVSSQAMSNKSLGSIRTKMMQRLYPRDIIDTAIDNYSEQNEDSDQEALDNAAERLTRNSSFSRLEPMKRKQKFIRQLASKGFSLDGIYQWINDHPEEMNQE